MFKDRETKVIDIITAKKSIHYFDLAIELGTSTETARRTAILLTKKYPRNFEYNRGILRLIKPLTYEDLPTEKKLEALQKTVEVKEKIEKKLKTNHLPHLERAILEGNLKKISQEFRKLKSLLEGEEIVD